jgi:hypothetical protein
MARSNKLSVGLASLAAVSVIAVGGGAMALAEDSSSGTTLADRIATKFNLNKNDVQAVFDEEHKTRQAERLADVSQDLQASVEAGKITAEQKTLIENKTKENQAAREAEMTALRDWATTNNINMRYLMGGGLHGANLDDAVADGDISPEQKTLIEQKRDELEKARDAKRDAMQQWAQDNNIDEQYLHFGKGGQSNRGGGHRGGN